MEPRPQLASVSRSWTELLTLCNDRLDITVSGQQVEAPISHLTVPRDGGSPGSGGRHRSVRTMESPESAPRGITAAVLRQSSESRL
ncbi:hypothetical protein AQJ91_39130 [Streptomyces dysideae]|uniref:Uncharacterized protein n=1 Tax=Streptomyces dysideae TaxID=909626 RepID=A0A101US85_9ACTN|nr:hypothetical protein AQJ91_39130 [Streptomyces dysideae]